MPLVDVTGVKLVVGDTTLSDPQITQCIATADLMITEDLQPTSGLSTARLTEIERYLAAHFVAIADYALRVATESLNQRSIESEYTDRNSAVTGKGLDYTRFGQMAMTLDTSKTLAALQKQGRAIFYIQTSNSMNGEFTNSRDIAFVNQGNSSY